MKKQRLVIKLEGGLVQAVYGETPIEVLVIDRDDDALRDKIHTHKEVSRARPRAVDKDFRRYDK